MLARGNIGGHRGLIGRNLTHERLHRLRHRGHLLGSDCDAGLAQQLPGVLALLGQHHRDDVTGAPGPRGAPGPVQVGLVLAGRIDVHDKLDLVDVYTTRGDIGRHQHPGAARGEPRQVALPSRLRQVAVQVD